MMNAPSWQTIGLILREEFQAWAAQLLQGFAWTPDWIADLQTLDRLAMAVDSVVEIETGFWQLEADLTSDFLPSFEGSSHQVAMNALSSPMLGENFEAQRRGVFKPFSETGANLPVQNASFEEASKMATKVPLNRWNGVEASSEVSSTQSLPNEVVRRKLDTASILERPFYSSPLLPESFSHSTVASSALPNISSPSSKTVTKEPNITEMRGLPGKPWVTVSPIAVSSPVESTFSTARPMVGISLESDAATPSNLPPSVDISRPKSLGDLANLLSSAPLAGLEWEEDDSLESNAATPSNLSPSAETSRPKSLGDLANLVSSAPLSNLEWEEDDTEASLEEFSQQAFNSREVSGIMMDDTIRDVAPAHPFAEPNRNFSNFQKIPPVAINHSPSLEIHKSAHKGLPPTALPVTPFDLEEVLEAVQRQVNQEYRRFYGG